MNAARGIPALRSGIGIAGDALRRLGDGRSVVVVADERVPGRVVRAAGPAEVVRLRPAEVDAAVVGDLGRRVRALRPELLVALGGGSIIDAVKIAALAPLPGRLLEYALAAAERSAYVPLPRPGAPGVAVAAVPTTAGTSSESSAVAVLRTDRGTRLLRGPHLRARFAVLDAELLATLPRDAMRAACLEALLRTAAANTAAEVPPRAREDSGAIARALLAEGERLGEPTGDTPAVRLRVARLSAATQRSGALRVPDTACAKHWYVANELSFARGVSKMAATAAVVPAVWDRIEAGDARWGDRMNLRSYWAPLAAVADLPETPARGIRSLIERWGLEPPPAPDAATRGSLAETVAREWGVRVPLLRGISANDVNRVLDDASWSTAWPIDATRHEALSTGRR